MLMLAAGRGVTVLEASRRLNRSTEGIRSQLTAMLARLQEARQHTLKDGEAAGDQAAESLQDSSVQLGVAGESVNVLDATRRLAVSTEELTDRLMTLLASLQGAAQVSRT